MIFIADSSKLFKSGNCSVAILLNCRSSPGTISILMLKGVALANHKKPKVQDLCFENRARPDFH